MHFLTKDNSFFKLLENTEVNIRRKTKTDMAALLMVDKKAQIEQLCLSLPWNTRSEWKWFKATIPDKRKKTENNIIRVFLKLLILASLCYIRIINNFLCFVNALFRAVFSA